MDEPEAWVIGELIGFGIILSALVNTLMEVEGDISGGEAPNFWDWAADNFSN